MRKVLILLALAVLTVGNTGCSRCRGLFRRGAPCGGTTLAAPNMLGGAIPIGQPRPIAQPRILPQMIPQNTIAPPNYGQPNFGQQCVPCCPCVPCDPCENMCNPCESGYHSGGDCGCQTGAGEYFGGYLEGSSPTMVEGTVIEGGAVLPEGSSAYPGPANAN